MQHGQCPTQSSQTLLPLKRMMQALQLLHETIKSVSLNEEL